jgi:hypothetical protein
VAFTFDAPLESLHWLYYDGDWPMVATLPAVGGSLELPAFDIFAAIETTVGGKVPERVLAE